VVAVAVHPLQALALQVRPGAQALPQRPQCDVDARRSASQPSAAAALQSANPGLQVKPQVPEVQVAVVFAGAGQTRPHIPQLAGRPRLVSQPSLPMPLQLAKPEMQVKEQTPPLQTVVAFARAGQTIPHIPQFDASVSRFRSHPSALIPLQSENPASHPKEQTPPPQTAVAFAGSRHASPHALQCAGLEVRSVSQPSVGSASQSPRPETQAYVQARPVHATVVEGRATHARPQLPQWSTSLVRSRSHPVIGSMSQSARSGSQVSTHAEPTHMVLANGRPGHAAPHALQCITSAVVSTSQPSVSLPLQSSKPSAQT
jgi:hypothetical protein